MTGMSNLDTGYNTLTSLLNKPMPGKYSTGFDDLSDSYNQAQGSGMADIARRGLTTTGAVPSLYTDLGKGYAKGAGDVIAKGNMDEQDQKMKILAALLNLGNAGVGQARAGMGSNMELGGIGADLGFGAFGASPNNAGFLSQGLPGFLSKIF